MKAYALRRDEASADRLAGRLLCHPLRGAQGEAAFAKGAVIQEGDVPAVMALPWDVLHLVERAPDELLEEDAGRRLASAVAGDGIEVRDFSGGRSPLAAAARGILRVNVDALQRMNSVEGVSVYTLYDRQITERGDVVAQAKITPFVLAESRVAEAERIARDADGVVKVHPFVPMTVGAVVKESLGERAMARFRDALQAKIAWFGSRLVEPAFVSPTADAIAAAIELLRQGGAQVIIVAGAKAMDPLDPAFQALETLGIGIDRHGVPAHPGSLFWLGHAGNSIVLGMPTCGLFSKATVFDLILPRVLAGETVNSSALAELGHGGLLSHDMAYRFPPYDPSASRGAAE
ncbi:MAG TPA: hypothetical protein VFW98_17950 [Gemmatimonadaceae bacterium]|nr:hypothetical protein [Gemmatimonadaceae bacterium]